MSTPPPDLDPHARALLRAAREVGLLEALLTEAGTVEAAAERLDVDPGAVRLVAEVCEREGLLTRVGDELEPTNRALGLVTDRDVRSIGRLPQALDVDAALADLPDALAGDRGATRASIDDGRRRHRVGAAWATPDGVLTATVTAAIAAAPQAERVLDLGGLAGAHAAEFARRGRSATLHETASVAGLVEPVLAHHDVAVSAGDLADPPEGPFDLVLAPQVPHRVLAADLAAVLAGARACCRPGAPVVVTAYPRDGGNAGVRTAVEALATGTGHAPTRGELGEALESAGVEAVATRPIPRTERIAAAGRAPDG